MPFLELPQIVITSHEHPFILAIAIIISFSMTFFAFYKRLLDIKGAIGALAVGLIISIFTDITWLFAVIAFLVAGSVVTRVKLKHKRKKGIAEGKLGERGLNNVIANGFIPCFIAFFSYHLDQSLTGLAGLLFLVSLATAASDTFASEIGVISEKAYMITSFNRIPPGTDGGISLLGETAALFGALIVTIVGWPLVSDMFFTGSAHLLPWNTLPVILFVVVMCWIGCQIDSVLGALFQHHSNLLNNDLVNFITIAVTVIIAWAICVNGLVL
jgi:uncharacterized protein (TIGR00297 family)